MKTTSKATLDRSSRPTAPVTPPDDSVGDGGADISIAEGAVESGGTRRRFKEVWLVEDRREGKSMWTRVGTAFENNDGSWNIRLSAMPVAGGRLNMRDPLVRSDEERAERQERQARKVAA